MKGNKSFLFIMGNCWVVIAYNVLPSETAYFTGVVVVQAALAALGIRWYIAGDRERQAERKRELQVRHIRELEKELGYEPLELGDPTEIPEPEYRRPSPQEG